MKTLFPPEKYIKKFDGKNWYKLAQWVTYSKRFLKRNPKCYQCGDHDATQVDHILPHCGNWNSFTDTNNHLPLCGHCHGQVTRLFDSKATPETKVKLMVAKLDHLANLRGRYESKIKVCRIS